MLRHSWIGVSIAGLMAVGCVNFHPGHDKYKEEADEVPIKFADAPAAVQATLTKAADGNAIESLDKETHHGKWVYEADVMLDGKNYEIKVAEDGTLISKKLDEEKDGKEEHGGK